MPAPAAPRVHPSAGCLHRLGRALLAKAPVPQARRSEELRGRRRWQKQNWTSHSELGLGSCPQRPGVNNAAELTQSICHAEQGCILCVGLLTASQHTLQPPLSAGSACQSPLAPSSWSFRCSEHPRAECIAPSRCTRLACSKHASAGACASLPHSAARASVHAGSHPGNPLHCLPWGLLSPRTALLAGPAAC